MNKLWQRFLIFILLILLHEQENNDSYFVDYFTLFSFLFLYNESIAALEISISIQDYHKTHDKLGLVYVELNLEDEAIESFKEAIKLNQRYAKAHNDLATVYGHIGEFDLALLELDEAIRIDKDYADAHYNLGILLKFLGEENKARKEFKIAYNLEPGNELYRKRLDK